jgi:hypothetical protein
MKTFAETFAGRGMDDWDVAQAVKKLQASLKRGLNRPDPRYFPNPADFADWEKRGLTGPDLTAAYVKQWEGTHHLLACPRAAAPKAETARQVAAAPSAPAPAADLQRPTRRPRTAPQPCRRNPLEALLDAVHDAHLAAREGARRARRHVATA